MGKSKSHKILGTKSKFFFWLNAMKMLNFNLLELRERFKFFSPCSKYIFRHK